MEWQPIESAPKELEQLIVFYKGETKRDPNSYLMLWHENGRWFDDDEDEMLPPTNWMHLPPPPPEA